MLSEKNMFWNWIEWNGTGGTDLYGSDTEGGMMPEEGEFDVKEGFADPDGTMEVDCALDPELEQECPFSNAGINSATGDN